MCLKTFDGIWHYSVERIQDMKRNETENPRTLYVKKVAYKPEFDSSELRNEWLNLIVIKEFYDACDNSKKCLIR